MFFPCRENNCHELKKETEDKIQTLVTDHKAKVRLHWPSTLSQNKHFFTHSYYLAADNELVCVCV